MSLIIRGPYPNMKTTLLLPSPKTGNTEGLRASVQTLRTMNGTLYTYKKPKRGRRVFRWDFTTSKEKALEAKEFVRLYAGGLVQSVDYDNVLRIGYININPLDARGDGRASGWSEIAEAVSFTLEFEERV